MGRRPRQHQRASGGYYHVMNRGHNREVVFQTEDDHAYFLDLLERYRQRCAVRLYPYCLMDNHFHLLARAEQANDLSPCMAGLLRAYVHSFHRRYGFVGHLWQGRFQSPAVAVEAYFLRCARYLERNPLEAGVVAEPWTYRWSSCPAYALGRHDPLFSYNVWYQERGADAGQRSSSWREFLLGDDPQEALVRRGDWVLGDVGLSAPHAACGGAAGASAWSPTSTTTGPGRVFSVLPF